MQCGNKAISTFLIILLTAIITAGAIYIYQNETQIISEEISPEINTEEKDKTTEEISPEVENLETNAETNEDTSELTGTPEDIEQNFIVYQNQEFKFTLEIPLGWGAQTDTEVFEQSIMNGSKIKAVKVSSNLIPKNNLSIYIVPVSEESNIGDLPAKELSRNSEYIFLGTHGGCFGMPGCDLPEDERRQNELESVLNSFRMFD